MNHIIEKNTNNVDFCLNRRELWDFTLSTDPILLQVKQSNPTLISFIDFNNPDCIWWNNLYSDVNFLYGKSKNSGVTLSNIGITGTDNGLLLFERDRITNEDFLNLILNYQIHIEDGDYRLQLHKVNGNNGIFDYSCDIVNENDTDISRFYGGFYQGFWKTPDNSYQVLPDNIGQQTIFEFTLKPSDIKNEKYTLNDKFPDNKGIFFYIGTRSENKWHRFYNDITNYGDDKCALPFEKGTIDNSSLKFPLSYIKPTTDEDLYDIEFAKGGYIAGDYIDYGKECINMDKNECPDYFADDYITEEKEIKETDVVTKKGNNATTKYNEIEIETDNKFLLFDRTQDGYTINNWDRDVEKATIISTKKVDVGNYHILFNKTENGYTTQTIDTLIDKKLQEYDINADLYNNALCFQIKENGSIGYKYLIKDCNTHSYKIESEWSKPNNVLCDNWYNIKVSIKPYLREFMKLKFYINDKLVLISKKLPLIQFRKLDEYNDKQEGVPYNISIGGGTQGLCDVVYYDYIDFYDKVLPIEENFCGSFVGYMKSFKMWHLESLTDNC